MCRKGRFRDALNGGQEEGRGGASGPEFKPGNNKSRPTVTARFTVSFGHFTGKNKNKHVLLLNVASENISLHQSSVDVQIVDVSILESN